MFSTGNVGEQVDLGGVGSVSSPHTIDDDLAKAMMAAVAKINQLTNKVVSLQVSINTLNGRLGSLEGDNSQESAGESRIKSSSKKKCRRRSKQAKVQDNAKSKNNRGSHRSESEDENSRRRKKSAITWIQIQIHAKRREEGIVDR